MGNNSSAEKHDAKRTNYSTDEENTTRNNETDNNKSIDGFDKNGETQLTLAVKTLNFNLVKELVVEAGASPECRNRHSWTRCRPGPWRAG